MKKLKIFILIIGLIPFSNVIAQNNRDIAKEIVKIFHKDNLENRFNFQPFLDTDSLNTKNASEKIEGYKKELYNKLAEEYRAQFDTDELNNLFTFYTSKLGEKVLKNKAKNNQAFFKLLFALEKKQEKEEQEEKMSGILFEDPENLSIGNKEDELIDKEESLGND